MMNQTETKRIKRWRRLEMLCEERQKLVLYNSDHSLSLDEAFDLAEEYTKRSVTLTPAITCNRGICAWYVEIQ